MNPNMLKIEAVDSSKEAPNYNRDMVDIRPISVVKAIVVGKGTVDGKATVDLILQTQDGATFVTMLTGTILRGLVAVIDGVEARTKRA